MDNWKQYIENKFQPKDEFVFDNDETSNTWIITHEFTGTSFSFYWNSKDWSEIADVQFHNNKTRGWSGESNKYLKYNRENVLQVDNFLNPAFVTGWGSKDIYLFGKHFKSIVSWNTELIGEKFKYYSSDLGCLSVILFPIFEVLSYVFGQVKIVKVPPIRLNK